MKLYFSMVFLMIFTLVIMITIIGSNKNLKQIKKSRFILMYSLIIVAVLMEAGCIFIQTLPSKFNSLGLIATAVEYSITPLLPIICGTIFVRTEKRELFFLRFYLICNIVFEFTSIVFKQCFYFNSSNELTRAPLYFVYIVFCITSLFIFFSKVKKFSELYQNRNGHLIILMTSFIVIGVLFQLIDPEIKLNWFAITIECTFMYVYYNEIIQYVDGLTKLLNQRSYKNFIGNIYSPSIIIVFDVDNFKTINDVLGHQYGDVCLVEISKAIKSTYGKYGTCFRIGGDEFCVIMDSNLDAIRDINDTFFKTLSEIKKEDKNLPLVSLGYELFNPEYDNISDIIYQADQNMYKIKKWSRENKKDYNPLYENKNK